MPPAASPHSTRPSTHLSCHCEERSDVATCCSCPLRTAASPPPRSRLQPSLLSLRGAQRRRNLLFLRAAFRPAASPPPRSRLQPSPCHCEERSDVATCCSSRASIPPRGQPTTPLSPPTISLSLRGAQRRRNLLFLHRGQPTTPLAPPSPCHCEERSDVATCCSLQPQQPSPFPIPIFYTALLIQELPCPVSSPFR